MPDTKGLTFYESSQIGKARQNRAKGLVWLMEDF